MKKSVFALAVLLLATPVRALDVWCTMDFCDVTVSFSGARDGASPVRGMAFDIRLDGGGTIANVQCLSANYGYQIYPGSISTDSGGNVSDWGSCKCDGGYPGTLDQPNAMTIEMAAMYEDGVDPDPCDAGDLVSFIVEGAALVNVTITVNQIRGGVVNEDVSTPIPVITGCGYFPRDCLCVGDPGYARWSTTLGRPDCWCYRRQCRGDIDGVNTGPFPVAIPDLVLFKEAFNQVVLPDPPGACADLDHLMTGPFACGIPDLTIFKTYFNKVVVPQCDEPPIITGCYNWWTN